MALTDSVLRRLALRLRDSLLKTAQCRYGEALHLAVKLLNFFQQTVVMVLAAVTLYRIRR
jgi:hypothetical protein